MPLHINRPVVPAEVATGANVRQLLIDLSSKRIVVEVIYGEVKGNTFTRRTDFPAKKYVIEGDDFDAIAAQRAPANKSLYDVIKSAVWNTLISKGWESGTIM